MDAFTEPTAEQGRVPVAYGERWPEGELIEALYREAYGRAAAATAVTGNTSNGRLNRTPRPSSPSKEAAPPAG